MTTHVSFARKPQALVRRRRDIEQLRRGIAIALDVPLSSVWPTTDVGGLVT